MNPWSLPVSAEIGGETVRLRADFRQVLQVVQALGDENLPPLLRWLTALELFYDPVPQDLEAAMAYLGEFVAWGQPGGPGPKLLDWQADAPLIIADVNKAAGCEVREKEFLHWWTFLGWFRAIGQGQLSMVVAIRDKLRRGKKLESWEQEFYRENRALVQPPRAVSGEDKALRERLNALVDGAIDS